MIILNLAPANNLFDCESFFIILIFPLGKLYTVISVVWFAFTVMFPVYLSLIIYLLGAEFGACVSSKMYFPITSPVAVTVPSEPVVTPVLTTSSPPSYTPFELLSFMILNFAPANNLFDCESFFIIFKLPTAALKLTVIDVSSVGSFAPNLAILW